ncbi:MAG: NAD(P)H-hydrate dehydratase [Steroidobacter sp.]
MDSLPLAVHTAAQVRALERHAIETLGIASYSLMTRAGVAAFAALRNCWPSARRVVVVCGPGNNGGDGYVLARLALEEKLDLVLMAIADPAQLEGDARRACDDFIAAGGAVQPWSDRHVRDADVIVDAIFGTGLSRDIDVETAKRIRSINDSTAAVFALDVPSGLHADSGATLGAAIVAARTMAFIGLKLGFYLGVGADHTGAVMFDALGAPSDALASIEPAATRIAADTLVTMLPPRRRTTHKGAQGRVLVLGGGLGMAGAARMAAEAALRVGAGLVTVATRAENVAAIVGARPELICRGVEAADELKDLIDRADVLALGPGLGQDEWAKDLLDAALEAASGSSKLAIIDADGLNLLAKHPRANPHWILTPHPGEAARLLGSTTQEIQADRLRSAQAIAERYQATVVLMGAGRCIVSSNERPCVCDQGNPGMATAGMGDVLTGVIAGIAAQTGDRIGAARAGVLAHAMAGDMAARRGERGLLATDLFDHLQSCVNPTQHS